MSDYKSKKKILVLTSSFPIYKGDPCGNFIFELTEGLSKYFDLAVLAPYKKSAPIFEAISAFSVYRFAQTPFSNVNIAYGDGILQNLKKNKFLCLFLPYYLLSNLLKVRKIIRINKINVILAHWLIPQGLVAVLYKRLINKNIKIVVNLLGSDIWQMNTFLGNILKRFVINNIDEISAVSVPLKERAIELGFKKRIDVIPLGTHTRTFVADSAHKFNIEEPTILFVGRVIEGKGIRYLVNAMPELILKFPKIKLLIIGDGNLKEELYETSQRLGLDKNIDFLGKIQHDLLPEYFSKTDIFILPSLSEGFPLVVSESLSSGIPTIVTDLPVFTKLEGGDKFLTIVKKESSKDISDKVCHLLSDVEKLNEISIRSREYAKNNLDWEEVCIKYKNLLESI